MNCRKQKPWSRLRSTYKHFKIAIMNKCIDLLEIINFTDCLKFIILT